MELTRLELLIKDQRQEFLAKSPGTLREVNWLDLLTLGRIFVITGIRRSGKSTLLRQMAESAENGFTYFNFDDIRLSGFTMEDYNHLLLLYSKMDENAFFLFDEIQMAPSWERFLRRLSDMGCTIIVTGSNSSILSDELGSHLTGRYLKQELYPFSFTEYLSYIGMSKTGPESTRETAEIVKHSMDYLETGGFPEYLKHSRRELLEQTFRDILLRDIIARHGIQEKQSMLDLALYLMSISGNKISYGKLAVNLGFKSATSVKEYLGYMEDVYLLFQLRRFAWSLKRSMLSPRKIYPIDNGMSGSVAFSISPDYGHKLETAVFIELKRQGEVWYYSNRGECDFITKSNTGYRCIQVCWHLDDENINRELNGLSEAMDFFKAEEGTIITINQEDSKGTEAGKKVKIIPFWRWMLKIV